MSIVFDTSWYAGDSFGDENLSGSTSFFTGSASSETVPRSWPVALNGIDFMVDFNQPFYRQYRRQMASVVRTQADTSTDPGEQTMDPNGLWRRSTEDWSLGAGQRYRDRHASITNGFWQSKGIDALTTKWQFTLLPDTTAFMTSSNTNLQVIGVEGGGYMYIADGTSLKYSAWPFSSPTTVTGMPGTTISSIATDGYTVYAACGADGVYETTVGSASASQLVTSSLTAAAVVAYVNGRLMVSDGANLYNITSTVSAALPAALFTHGAPNFKFNAFADGNDCLYVSGNTVNSTGYPVDGGIIYGVTVQTDGTTLNPPQIQGMLPGSETVNGMYFYLGSLVLTTSLGVRWCSTDSSGGVSLGALIPTSPPTPTTLQPSLMTGYSRFVYFPWTDYDSASTGVGRMDLENFAVQGVQPAYCSDVMSPSGAITQGVVTSVAHLNGSVFFAVAGKGVYVASTNLVPTGFIDSGYILYDLVDTKIATLLDCRTNGALEFGSYTAEVSVDNGSFSVIGTQVVGGATPVSFAINEGGERFEIRIVLNADTTTTTQGPTFTRWTLRSYPAPVRPLTWQLPLIINEKYRNMAGREVGDTPLDVQRALETMLNLGGLVIFQEGQQSYPVFVSDVAFLPDQQTEMKDWFNGIALVTLLGIPGYS